MTIPRVIGLCGFIGSGKDTTGQLLNLQAGYIPISFASALKDTVSQLFDYDRDMIDGSTEESREWREQPDEFWSKEFNEEITPRKILQTFGTDCLRNNFHADIWALIVKQKILKNPENKYVITDVRFPNEQTIVRDMGGEIWRIDRGDQPIWVNDAISDNTNSTSLMSSHNIHSSEWNWVREDEYFDVIIDNNKDMGHVIKQITNKLIA